jgi:hypothetical protein
VLALFLFLRMIETKDKTETQIFQEYEPRN